MSQTKEKSSPLVGIGDVSLLILCAVLTYFYFFFRKKQKVPTTTIKLIDNFETQPNESMIQKQVNGGKIFFVFFGSQTGTAESFAARLVQDAKKYELKGSSIDPEECDVEEIPNLCSVPNNIVLFVSATYGEGDPTDNNRDLYEWLQSSNPNFHGISYAVFGLGNKTYEHFNAMGKYFDRRLEELGGTRICDLGLGDDDACIEEDFIGWKEKFWAEAEKRFDLKLKSGDEPERQFKLINHTANGETIPKDKIFTGEYFRLGSYRNQKIPFDAKNPYLAPITTNRNIFHGGERLCHHIELDITGSRLKYEAGDHVAIYPANEESVVDEIGKLLNVNLDDIISLVNVDTDSSKKHKFPCPCSYRTALIYYVDISSPVRTNVIKDLSIYATDEKERSELQLMATYSDEGKALYNANVMREHMDLVSLLHKYPSLKPPLDHICELLPRLQQRYYSISSSPKVYPDSIHITVVVTRWNTPTGKLVKGVATNWLIEKTQDGSKSSIDPLSNGQIPNHHETNNHSQETDDNTGKDASSNNFVYGSNSLRIPIYVRRSQFKLPLKKNLPIIMIGPGTGLAPFRGFLQQRKAFKDEGKPMGENILFFGCRHQAIDYIYREELEKFVKDGILTHLFTAFSRDQPHKIYVTHLIKEQKDLIWEMIDKKGGHIYICGDAKNMAKDVHNILLYIFQTKGSMDEKDAEAYIKMLQNKSRYQSDVWS